MPISPTLPTDGQSDWDVPLNAALTELVDGHNDNETAIAGKLDTSAAPELIRDTMGTALVAGANVTITPNDVGDTITIAASGGGGAAWGSISGTLSSQTDLQSALDGKIPSFTDPNADRIVFWDDSAGAYVALTPSAPLSISSTTLSVSAATDTAQGIVELATTGEATTGTDTSRAVTAAGVKAVVDAHVALSDPHTQYLKEADAANYRDAVFSQGGTLTTGTGVFRLYNRSGVTRTIQTVTASVGTQPTGASILVDVNISGTTIFTTQSNRPTIAVSTSEDQSGTPDVTAWTSGSYLTIDIDQIGSTVAGANLTVTVVYS